MRAHELHQTASYLRERYVPPEPTMTPGKYVSHEAMHALADALDRVGDDVAEHEITVAAPARPDDAYLRHEALRLAVESQLGYAGADALARAADTLVAFLRDGTAAPDPHPEQSKGADLPGQPGAPAALHEALDRAWQGIRQDGDRLAATSDDEDEDVLEQLRQLGTDEIARAGFALAIVRALAQSVRADRIAARHAAAEGDAEAERDR